MANPLAKSSDKTEANVPVTAYSAPKPRFTIKPTRQSCLVLGGLTGAVLCATVGMYLWQQNEIGSLDQHITARQTELTSSEKIAVDLDKVMQTDAETRSQLRFLETSVTAGEYVPTLLHQTEDLAKSVNLQVGSIRPTLEPAPKPPTDKDALKKFKPQPYDKLHLDVDVTGKYWDVARMLYRLTEFPKILAVESLQVSPSAGAMTGVAPTLSVHLKLTGFIFPNDVKTPLTPPATAPAPVGVAPTTPPKTVAAPIVIGNTKA